jgi:hypothetical protein
MRGWGIEVLKLVDFTQQMVLSFTVSLLAIPFLSPASGEFTSFASG